MAGREAPDSVMVGLLPNLTSGLLVLLINGKPIPIDPASARILAESLTRLANHIEYEQHLMATMRAMSADVPPDEQLDGDEIAAVVAAVRVRIFGEHGKALKTYINGVPAGRKVRTG